MAFLFCRSVYVCNPIPLFFVDTCVVNKVCYLLNWFKVLLGGVRLIFGGVILMMLLMMLYVETFLDNMTFFGEIEIYRDI